PLAVVAGGGAAAVRAVRVLVERVAATPPALDRAAVAGPSGTGLDLRPASDARAALALVRPSAAGHDGVMSLPPPPAASMPDSVVNCAAYDRNGERRDITLDAISDVLEVDDGSFVWVGLYEPGEGVLDKLQEEFGLHDLAVEDAHHAHQRPKIETYGQSLFIALHTAQTIDSHIRFGETHVFVGPRYLVTVRHG